MNVATSYVTLDSQDGLPTSEPGVLRFDIDSVYRNVSEVKWLTMEVRQNHALTIDGGSSTLYFTEDLTFFRAELPHGSYTCQSLCKALEAAMCCATDVLSPESEGPRNGYSVRMLGDSSRLCISSDGTVAFSLHTYQALLKVLSVRRLSAKEAQMTIACHEAEPIARGSVLQVFRPTMLPATVQVIHAVGNVLMVRDVEGALDLEIITEGWTVQALCQQTSLPELLGLGGVDLRSSQPIQVMSSSSPLLGTASTTLPEARTMHVGLACPHGCVEGDVVLLDGFEGGFMNGQQARVQSVVSEQQLLVQVDASHMGVFPKDQLLRLSVLGKEYAFRVHHSMLAHAQHNMICVKVFLDRADMAKVEALKALKAATEWLPAKVLPPVPCREWLGGQVSLRVDSSKYPGSLMLRCPYQHLSSPNAYIKRNAVVGLKKMNLLHKKSVLLMRLRLGMKEALGVLSLKSNNMHVFGRAQMKDGGFLASSDHSLVGRARFDPPLERVPFLEVAFVTPQGCVVQPNVLGEYSLLLCLYASS